ncbi:MAG: hypothetical protein L0387_37540 [Acidobacteria bacterium]|nr:hypothetical protein [Acidobacteriota bacterium]
MSSRLDSKPQIWTLAADLGLAASESPGRNIIQFVASRIKRIARKFHCRSLNELLVATAGEVETTFEEIHSDDDLRQIRLRYVSKGEQAFANLEQELRGVGDYAITIRRVHREEWEPQFVSVIDCRGGKTFRSYFSKWHELAHLLTLTPQMRLVFRRTHSDSTTRDPEEMLMDVIASEVGFFRDFLPSDTSTDISFESIRRIKEECCPDASLQAATIGIVKALPVPCILLEARMALRKGESADALQMGLGIGEQMAVPALRAVHVTVNNAARDIGIWFHKNWRVPSESVISRVFTDGGYSESTEDLNWWVTSDGSGLNPCPVLVKAKETWGSVQALLVPQIDLIQGAR